MAMLMYRPRTEDFIISDEIVNRGITYFSLRLLQSETFRWLLANAVAGPKVSLTLEGYRVRGGSARWTVM